MAMWIMRREGAPLESSESFLFPPEDSGIPWPLLKECHSEEQLRNRLRRAYPDLPPESQARMASRAARFLFAPKEEDIVVFYWPQRAVVTAAEITGKRTVQPDGEGRERPAYPMRDFGERWMDTRFMRFRDILDRATSWPREVQDAKFRTFVRDRLRLPGSRFARWKWLFAIVVGIKVLVMVVHIWKRETAGF